MNVEPQLMADIEIHEYGEPDRVQTIGPFDVDPDDSDPIGTLEASLRERGDDVLRVYRAEASAWSRP